MDSIGNPGIGDGGIDVVVVVASTSHLGWSGQAESSGTPHKPEPPKRLGRSRSKVQSPHMAFQDRDDVGFRLRGALHGNQ